MCERTRSEISTAIKRLWSSAVVHLGGITGRGRHDIFPINTAFLLLRAASRWQGRSKIGRRRDGRDMTTRVDGRD